MAQNPLQKYFRQPKIFISLPSHGVYNTPGNIDGDVEHIPVFGMTGMDEILIKTPDALLTGESTAQVIASCVPAIKDPWELSSLDTDLVLTAIRIATYGSGMTVGFTCKKCATENEYELDLTNLIEHYGQCRYDNKVVVGDLSITVQPLNYKQTTHFSLLNFQLQQKLSQIVTMTESEEQKILMAEIFKDLASLRNNVYASGIESVHTGSETVTERAFITEWLANCDSSVVDAIKKHIESNQETWQSPKHQVKCDNCGEETAISVELDQATFFVNA